MKKTTSNEQVNAARAAENEPCFPMMKKIPVALLDPHPRNREFAQAGECWEQMVASVVRHGVLMPVMVRQIGERFQVLAGHRRRAAAMAAGLETLPVMLKELDDVSAAEFVLLENLQREEVDAYEEARGVRGLMEECGRSAEEVAQAISRSVRWVKSRQLLLDLPEEVVAAVRRPRGAAGHLSMGAVEEILKVPAEWRAEAVQLVLHPDLEAGVLNEDQSREVLRRCLLEPRRREAEWEANCEVRVKAWRGVLKGYLQDIEEAGLLVISAPWGERERISREGEAALDRVRLAEQSTEAPDGLLWLHLAVRHGMAVRLVPDDGPEGSRPVVDAALLRQAESARADGGEKAWLVTKRRSVAREVEHALAVLDGQGEVDFDEEEPAVEQVTQTMERHAYCNLTRVHELRDWALAAEAGDALDWPSLPDWAVKLHLNEFYDVMAAACDWMLATAVSSEGGTK